MSEETLTYDLVEYPCFSHVYHVFGPLSKEKYLFRIRGFFYYIVHLNQYIFYSLIGVKSLDMFSTYINLFATMVRFRNKKIRASRSLEVAGHQQYLVRS